MKKIKRNYSEAFKSKAVALSYERENMKELALELGISVERIYKWRASEKSLQSPVKSASTRLFAGVSQEEKRLQKELKETKLELEILKKAVHIFSRNDGKSINL